MCNKKPMDLILCDLIVARNIAGYGSTKRRECRSYFCDFCGAYHLTSQRKNFK